MNSQPVSVERRQEGQRKYGQVQVFFLCCGFFSLILDWVCMHRWPLTPFIITLFSLASVDTSFFFFLCRAAKTITSLFSRFSERRWSLSLYNRAHLSGSKDKTSFVSRMHTTRSSQTQTDALLTPFMWKFFITDDIFFLSIKIEGLFCASVNISFL